MITCHELLGLLYEIVADDLAPPQRDDVEQHLQECPPCVAYLESYRITVRLCRRLPCPPPPAEVMERLRGAVEARLREVRGTGA
jgi:anti-sigma factor RsiW